MSTLTLLAAFLGLAAALPVDTSVGVSASTNETVHPLSARQSSNWWLPNIDYSNSDWENYAPSLGNDYSYQVYISVSDVQGLQNAIASGGPNGQRDNGYLAAEPRVIYIAPGTYELSSTLYLYTDTVLIGDAVNPPTIAAASGFSGDQLIAGGVNQDMSGNGGELKFSTQIRNVILDTTANSGTSDFTALSWRVAQNCALVNIIINLPSGVHTGITVGQGSTIQLGDTTINYGNIGVDWTGNQQGTIKNFVFNYCTYGIKVDSGFSVNIFHATFNTNGFPITLKNGLAAWVSVVDATVTNSGVFLTSNNAYPNFMLENIRIDSAQHDVVRVAGNTKVSGTTFVPTYVYGNTYGANPIYQTNNSPQPLNRPSQLTVDSNEFYPISTADQYTSATVNDVINLKNSNQNGGYTIKGDGYTNDGPNLQSALAYAANNGKIAFLPFGVYITEQTVLIPLNTRLVGMGWSTISGSGNTFSDASNPVPVVQVGNSGDVGSIEIQDIRFTVNQALPGAIIVEVNAAGSNPGDVSIHNSLITVGGTPDTQVNCGGGYACQAAYIGLHLTSSSSAYIDNLWAWVADHATDGSNAGTDSQNKGGVLVEATKGTWFSGLGSEHWWLYNLAYNGAENVFISLFQSETNYHQGSGTSDPVPPQPFSTTSSDPDFSWCSDDTCYMTINQYWSPNQSSNIFTYASGSWNFDGGNQDYVNVQSSIPSNSYMYGLCSGPNVSNNMYLVPSGQAFGDNSDYGGSWGELVAAYTTGSS